METIEGTAAVDRVELRDAARFHERMPDRDGARTALSITDGGVVTLRTMGVAAFAESTLEAAADGDALEAIVDPVVLAAALERMRGDEVEIAADGGHLVVGYGNGSATIAREAGEAPEIEGVEAGTDEVEFAVDAAAFAEALGAAWTAAVTDDARPTLRSVLLRVRDGAMRAVGADGYRLHIANVPCAAFVGGQRSEGAHEAEMLIGRETARWIAGQAARAGGEVTVAARGERVRAAGHGWAVIASTVTGAYPNYEDLVPVEPPTTLRLFGADVGDALKLMDAVEDTGIVRIEGRAGEAGVRAWVRNDAGVGAEASIEAEVVAAGIEPGALVRVALSRRLLRDAIAVCGGEAIEIGVQTPSTPVTVRGGGFDVEELGRLDGYVAVVMPIFVDWASESVAGEEQAAA